MNELDDARAADAWARTRAGETLEKYRGRDA
jgi:hypothetical protein